LRKLHRVNGRPSFSGRVPGRRDDDLDVLITYQPGTAFRPLRVQRRQPFGVKCVDYVPDGILIRGDQPGDRRDLRA